MVSGMLPALPAVVAGGIRALPALGRIIPGAGAVAGAAAGAIARRVTKQGFTAMSKKAAKAAGYFVVGQWIYDQAGNLIAQAPARRMNPLNHRALSRACRRIKSAKRILKKVERITGGSTKRACAPRRVARKC